MKGAADMTHTMNQTYQDREHYEYRRRLRQRREKLHRQREIRRNFCMVLLGIILILVLSGSYHAITSNATTEVAPVMKKCYTSIVIKPGETLTSLAQEYSGEHYESVTDYIREVMWINHLESSQIIAGEYIILPYYSEVGEVQQ